MSPSIRDILPLCFRSSSNKFVEEAPDADLLSDHRLLVEVGEEALGLVQSDHIVSEATSIPPLEYVHEAVGLNGEARDVPNGRVVVGIEVARATELAKVAHDVPCQRLSVGYEQYSLTAARRCRKVVLPEPYQLRTTSAFFGTVVHDLVGQDLEFPLVLGHPVAWTLVVKTEVSISVQCYTTSLANASLRMFSVGQWCSNISRLPSFAKARRLLLSRTGCGRRSRA